VSFPPQPLRFEYNTKRNVLCSQSFIPDCRQSVSLLIMYSAPKIKKDNCFYRYLYNKSCPSLALPDQLSWRNCDEIFDLRTNLLFRKSEGLVADILLLFRVTWQGDYNIDVSHLYYARNPIFFKPEFGTLGNI
jgi:hypothetical protein